MQSTDNNLQNQSDNQEINIGDFFRKLASEKIKIIKNLIWAVLVWFGILTLYLVVVYDSSKYYSIVLGLNYPQAAQGKYPNGTDFSTSDIVSSTVLEKVWSENRLGEAGVKLVDFQRSFIAVPFTGELNFIETKYRGMLATKNLSRTDIEKMEADYKAELAQASTKSIKIILDSRKADYTSSQASKILNDVAITWSKVSIEKLGVLRTPISDSLILNGEIKQEAPIVIVNYLSDVVDRAQQVITSMRSDTNSNTYRDEKTGANLAGLGTKLNEISNYQIDHLDVLLAIASKVTDVELLQTKNRIAELQEERKVLLMKAESVQRAVADYSGSKNQSGSSDLRGKSSSGNEGPSVQFNGEAINKLFNLATESKDAEYRQKMTAERLKYENMANDFNLRIAKLERRMGYMTAKIRSASGKGGDVEFATQVDRVWSGLQGVFDAISRIQLQARQDFAGNSGLLYTKLSESEPNQPGLTKLIQFGLITFCVALLLSLIATIVQITLFQSKRELVV
jgi:hypothetical protein